MFNSLRSRLLGSYILIILICLAVTGVVLTILLIPQVTRLTYLRLADKSLPTSSYVASLRRQGLGPEEIISRLEELAASQGTRILIVTRDGMVLADTENHWVGRGVDLSLQGEGPGARRLYAQGRLVTADGLFLYVAVPTGVLLRERGEAASP
ncbi:MAG: hypothetical protein WBB22_09675, partial [Anaerolineae bacterium]